MFSPFVRSTMVGDWATATTAGFTPSCKDGVRRPKLFLLCGIQKLPPDGGRAAHSKLRSPFYKETIVAEKRNLLGNS